MHIKRYFLLSDEQASTAGDTYHLCDECAENIRNNRHTTLTHVDEMIFNGPSSRLECSGCSYTVPSHNMIIVNKLVRKALHIKAVSPLKYQFVILDHDGEQCNISIGVKAELYDGSIELRLNVRVARVLVLSCLLNSFEREQMNTVFSKLNSVMHADKEQLSDYAWDVVTNL